MLGRLKNWCRLGNLPTASTTVASTLIGYFTVTSRLTSSVLYMMVMVFLLHFFIFSHNDVCDLQYDRNSRREMKPLVQGQIDVHDARIVSYLGIICCVVISYLLFELFSFLFLIVGVFLGVTYNRISSISPVGPVLLSFWGGTSILFGATVAGRITQDVIIVSVLSGIMLLHFTYAADIIDLHADSENLAAFFGVQTTDNFYQIPVTARVFEQSLNSFKIGLVLLIIYWESWIGLIALPSLILHTVYNQKYLQGRYSTEFFKSYLFRFVRTGIISIMFVAVVYIDIINIIGMTLGVFLWGFGFRLWLYGSIRAYS